MKKLVFFFMTLAMLWCTASYSQNVSNVNVVQKGNQIVVSYDIDNDAPEVQLSVSTDGGVTFSAPLKMLSGDIKDVRSGSGKIVWDVLSEWEELSGDSIVFNVMADCGGKYVDLGLSVRWAACNLGASSPEDYGGYYQWGGIQDVTSRSIYLDLNNCPCHTGSNAAVGWTKYNTLMSYGKVDNKTELESEDDVAHVEMGGGWRMPTDEEWSELRNNCSWTWSTVNGVKGYEVTSKKPGYTDRSIFLPAAGFRGHDGLYDDGAYGNYWSASLCVDRPGGAYGAYFNSNGFSGNYGSRYCGQSVRPVLE